MSSSALREHLYKIVKDITSISLPPNESDMFKMGMVSLQASRVRRAILDQLRRRSDSGASVELEKDFCFADPSADKMAGALLSRWTMAGEEVVDGEEGRIRGIEEMVGRYRGVLGSYTSLVSTSKNGADESLPPPPPPQASPSSVVLLTGSTGNLGCFLARLAQDPGVFKVICLNRVCSRSESIIHRRQKEALDICGAHVCLEEWAKVVLLDADVTKVDFGLGEQGVCRKKTPYTGLFYFDKDSGTPPPSLSLPKKKINHVFTNQIQLSTPYLQHLPCTRHCKTTLQQAFQQDQEKLSGTAIILVFILHLSE
jgi:hypothetical protein